MSRPVDARWPIGTPFGYKSKKNPKLWAAGKHTGTDFSCPTGTKVGATYDGVVVGVGNVWGAAYGKHQVVIESVFEGVVIRHISAHMTKYTVKKGQRVSAGDLLGYSGAEGHTFGAHLHYEERVKGKSNFGYFDYIAPRLLAAKPFVVVSTPPLAWTVATDLLNGRDAPVTGRTGLQRPFGFKLTTNARTVVDGKAWVRTKYGTWYAERYLVKATAAPTLPPAVVAGISEGSLNCAGYNDHGITTWKVRTAGIAKIMLASDNDVWYLEELSAKAKAPMRSALDSAVKHRYRRTKGSDGRYCYVRLSTMKVQRAGVMTAAKSTWYRGNDKQGAWHQSLHIKSGKVHAGMATHLEHRPGATADKLRVAQVISLESQFRAKTPGVKNRTTAGDFNSQLMVAKALVDKYGCVIAGGLTSAKPTFVGWDGHSKKRFDWAAVDADGNPTDYTVGTEKVSDHRPINWKRVLS